MSTLFDGELHVHYSQAYVFSGDAGDTGEMDSCFRGQSNGLLGAGQQGMLFLMTGLHTGRVRLQVNVEEFEPALEDEWEECVEASFAPAADARLVSWGGEEVCGLQLTQPGYRVRYEANQMDAGREADTILEGQVPLDSYRLSFWPASPAPDRIVRETSETARYWHGYAQDL